MGRASERRVEVRSSEGSAHTTCHQAAAEARGAGEHSYLGTEQTPKTQREMSGTGERDGEGEGRARDGAADEK